MNLGNKERDKKGRGELMSWIMKCLMIFSSGTPAHFKYLEAYHILNRTIQKANGRNHYYSC